MTDLWRSPPPDEPVGTRYLRILAAEGLLDAGEVKAAPHVRLRPDERAAGDATLAGRLATMVSRLPLASRRPPIVLVPDAGMAVKQWPAARWQTLAESLRADGHPVLAVTQLAGLSVEALPAVTLRQLAAVFAPTGRRGGAGVGGDTGPVRLAAAAGARTVALFGPTLASRYGVGAGADLQGLAACPHRRPILITEQVCWWDARCPLSANGPACMDDIDPALVAAAVRRLTR